MQYAELCGHRVSRLGMGNMRLPKRMLGIDYDHATRIIDYAVESGVNYFDTAYVYPGSEKFLGKALTPRHPRGDYFIATKYYSMGNPDYRKVFETQLQRLNTDYIDFYLIHCLTDGSYKGYVSKGSIEYFLEQKRRGRIRHLGFSTHASVATTARFLDHHDWDFCQMQLNYYDWAFGHAKEEYETITGHGVPIVVMEPVRGGKLASFKGDSGRELEALHPDWSAASWALRWVQRRDNARVILSGMSTVDQIVDNVATFGDRALNAREEELLLQSCGALREAMSLPCTACRYCCEGCPKGIDIPVAIDAYNEARAGNPQAASALVAGMGAGPADCIGCRACTRHCPQSIDIPVAMASLVESAGR